jgi:hypothetical protein
MSENILSGDSKGVLVLGKKTKRVKNLECLLGGLPWRVEVASNPVRSFWRNRGEGIDFIIVTESLDYTIDEDLCSRLRVLFPKAELVVVVDRLTREMEAGIRSKGLVFFGSYRSFVQVYQEIMGLAKGGERALNEKELQA